MRAPSIFVLTGSLAAACTTPGRIDVEGTDGGGTGADSSDTGHASASGDVGSGDGSSDGGDSTGSGTSQPPLVCHPETHHDGPWFVEVTDEVGLARTDSLEPLATGVVSGDLDGDGWFDLIAAVFPAQREAPGDPRIRFVFLNRPDPDDPSRRVFVDATEDSGLLATRDGVGGRGFSVVSLGDLDNDGDLDAVTCPGSGEDSVVDPCAAFLNDGAAHFELAAPSDLESAVFWVPSSAMLDYDLDGVLDFWPGTVGQWAYGPALTSAPKLFRGRGDGTFDDVSAAVGLPSEAIGHAGDQRMNFGLTACDIDLDGDRDLLVGNYYQQPNYLWVNGGEEGFVNAASVLGIDHDDVAPVSAGGHTFSIACGDIDDDGDVDLMSAEVRHAWVADDSDRSELLRNDTPAGQAMERFVRPGNSTTGLHREHIGGAWTEGDNIALLADIDLDGRKDVVLASSNYPQQDAGDPDWTHAWLWHQQRDGTFVDRTDATPWGGVDRQSGEGPTLIDYDHDGDLDLFIGTGTFNSAYLGITNTLRVYRNEVGHTANWTQLRLVGGGAGQANASGIGARVVVTSGGRAQSQEVLGSWGHSNTQSDVVLTFGLGTSCEIERVEVHWPDATRSVDLFQDVLPNYAITLTQGDPEVAYAVP